jgi:predicted DNA-binding transcriptional regulator YafY
MAGTKVEKQDQAERLLRYLELLSRGGSFSVRDTAEYFGIRREAVYRDMRRLGALGYPLEQENVSGRIVYRFPSKWVRTAQKLEFSIEELESALIAVEQYCRLGPPHRYVQLAVRKLQALHAESGPPARVRAWNSILRGAGGICPEGQGGDIVINALQRAIAESRWCDLAYLPMGSNDSMCLTFAPRRFVDGTVFGLSRDMNRWDVLNVTRILDVAVLEEVNTSVGAIDAILSVKPEAGMSGEMERVERQILRLVAIVRMLGAGKAALPTELATTFATTLNTIRRDRDLLETSGYSTVDVDFGSGLRILQNPAVFGSIPPLPIAVRERTALIHVLERFAVNYAADGHVHNVISKLRAIPDSIAALSVSNSHAESTDRDILWELVDAMLCGAACSVVYGAHRGLPDRLIVFTPREFQVGVVLRVKGVREPDGDEVILIVRDIFQVRVRQPVSRSRQEKRD